MQLAHNIKNFMSSKGFDTWFSNSGNELDAFNNDYLYEFMFSNDKLIKVEITDVNIRNMKCLKLPDYINTANDRLVNAVNILSSLKEFFIDEYLVNLSNWQTLEENVVKVFLLTYMSEEMYETIFKFDIERYVYE